jgi:predicted DNA binding CopG/RHH family protein
MKNKYTKEELEMLDDIESGELKSILNKKSSYSEYAANTLKKDKRINIRMSERDLESIQRAAIKEGIPYQTLISSLLHKYVSGRLVELKTTS